MSGVRPKKPSGIGIKGIGSYVPPEVLTNKDLEKFVDTSDEWITERTGIKKRHRASPDQATSDLASEAARRALEDANMSIKEIDAIIVGTATPDMLFPSTACLVQRNLGTRDVPSFDISAACSGFIYGLSIATGFIATGFFENVLVVGAETLSRMLDWKDRSTCVLFGDGAGAAVVGHVGDGRGFLSMFLGSEGSLADLLKLPAGGSKLPATEETVRNRLHFVKMEGNKLYKFAVRAMAAAAARVLEDSGYSGADLDLLVPHQANLRIINATAERIGVDQKKVYVNIDQYGNTSAASIPIALDEARRKDILKEGMLVEIVSFGGGLTWASCLMVW